MDGLPESDKSVFSSHDKQSVNLQNLETKFNGNKKQYSPQHAVLRMKLKTQIILSNTQKWTPISLHITLSNDPFRIKVS